MLHFEMHGFYGGIVTKNGDRVYWKDLYPLFQKLNTFYRNYLCIYLAVCEGASILESIKPEERAPFRSIIGSIKKVKSSDLLIGFENFYDHFFFTFDIQASLEKFNLSVENKKSQLNMINCDYCFDMICDFKRKSADRTKIYDLILQSLKSRIPFFNSLVQTEQQKFIEKEYENLETECKSHRDHFLMNDIRTNIHDRKL